MTTTSSPALPVHRQGRARRKPRALLASFVIAGSLALVSVATGAEWNSALSEPMAALTAAVGITTTGPVTPA